jgi:hypothetical protein
VTSGKRDDHRALAVHIEARRKAEIGRAGEFIFADLVAGGHETEDLSARIFGPVVPFSRVHPDGYLEIIEAAHVIPVRVSRQYAEQPAAIVAAGVELLVRGPNKS